jgi:hypothetical protein
MEGPMEVEGPREGQSLGQPTTSSASTLRDLRLPPQSTVLKQTTPGMVPVSVLTSGPTNKQKWD